MKQANRNQHGQLATLLGLPPEIRDLIYGYALHECECIALQDEPLPPAWLQACQQIRDNVLEMYYNLNRFDIVVRNLDTRLLIDWTRWLTSMGVEPKIYIVIAISHNWENLLAWCKAVWEDQAYCSLIHLHHEHARQTHVVVVTAHRIAVEYRGLPWERCVQALENHRRVVVAYCPLWETDSNGSVTERRN